MINVIPKSLDKVIILPVLVQFLLFLTAALYISKNLDQHLTEHAYIFICLTVSIIINFFLGRKLIALSLKDAQLKAKEAMGESIIKLNAAIEEQNEHFMDQIREISNLYQKQQIDDLATYLRQISNNITQVNDMLKVDQPIIGVLLKSKLAEADVRNIQLDIDISVSLARQKENALILARILGNLIDNAFEAVLSGNEYDKLVLVKISKTGPLLKIEVCNKGPVIPPEIIDNIFLAGYTLKGDNHGGLGLNIVKTLTEKLSGMVSVTSDMDTGTSFIVTIPAK
ncbi:MAG: Sensor histidine kinase DcuS [Pelotomaculum sp. PtaB.Bin013]|nr:MAG: Sensor histidine kinase DcuS [Pelotomaculum sp. PtaB.Bin013]